MLGIETAYINNLFSQTGRDSQDYKTPNTFRSEGECGL